MDFPTASQLDLAGKCSASWRLNGDSDLSSGAAAETGTKLHKVIERLITTGDVDNAYAAFDLALELGVADEWLEIEDNVRHVLSKAWDPAPGGCVSITEVPFLISNNGTGMMYAQRPCDLEDAVRIHKLHSPDIKIAMGGTIDYFVLGSTDVGIYDWKTGLSDYGPPRQSGQLISAAYAAMRYYGKHSARIGFGYVSAPNGLILDDDIISRAFAEEYVRSMKLFLDTNNHVAEGTHCMRCKNISTCGGYWGHISPEESFAFKEYEL